MSASPVAPRLEFGGVRDEECRGHGNCSPDHLFHEPSHFANEVDDENFNLILRWPWLAGVCVIDAFGLSRLTEPAAGKAWSPVPASRSRSP